MENATKALIISASVLIVLVLISLGISMMSSTSRVTDQVDTVAGNLETSIFNSQFTKYEGEQKGRDVKALLRLIKQTNLKNNGRTIDFKITFGTGDPISTNIDTVLQDVVNNEEYNVEISVDDNTGYVNRIVLTLHDD